MKHFISFQKTKGLAIEASTKNHSNDNLVHQLNHELMNYGFVLTKDVFEALSRQTKVYIKEVYTDVISGIKEVVGTGGHVAIYENFPQSVLALSYSEFLVNALIHYWSFGTWKPSDALYIKREFDKEAIDYKSVTLISESQFESLFTDLLYSGNSISHFDKKIVDYFIENGYAFNFSKISFKETAAYVGKRLFDDVKVTSIPTKDATNILRIWSAYSGGDEGLKTNTDFKNPLSRQRRVILTTLDKCYNLEESFKVYREKWLKLLFFVNPMMPVNQKKYPNVYAYTVLLRNTPKQLETFNAKVEKLLTAKDVTVLDLLKTQRGVFMRRLDHTVRLFGLIAVNKWLETDPNLLQLVNVYNHFSDRDKEQAGRGAVLASQDKSEVVTYAASAPLDGKLVTTIKSELLTKIVKSENPTLSAKKVFIDRALYYRPLATNNRASSLSLDGKVNGTVEVLPSGKTIRMYLHWHTRTDLDMSAYLITSDNQTTKVGWNSYHHFDDSVVFSGDNTGFADKNAEYIDITPDELPSNMEWVITDGRIFSGGQSFKSYNGSVRAGWMLRDYPEADAHWLPKTLEHSIVLSSESNTAYLMALHVPTRSVVYLDLNMGNHIVSTGEDALQMRTYLETFITLDDGAKEIKWDKINQGHVLNVISKNVVETKEDADLVFDENTTWESVSKYL